MIISHYEVSEKRLIMFCKKCGNKLPNGTKFCDKCGSLQGPPVPEAIPVQEQTTKAKPKTSKLAYVILGVFIIFAIIFGILLNDIESLGDDSREISKNELTVSSKETSKDEPAIDIIEISFDPSIRKINFKFSNISNKDIAYIHFDTYFYDRMGSALQLEGSFSEEYSMDLQYTGPLYAGDTNEVYWNYLLKMPSSTAVVFPKNITVTFFDDTEITFKNTMYAYSEGFYGGKLKDK